MAPRPLELCLCNNKFESSPGDFISESSRSCSIDDPFGALHLQARLARISTTFSPLPIPETSAQDRTAIKALCHH
jgi:hypothetical protein